MAGTEPCLKSLTVQYDKVLYLIEDNELRAMEEVHQTGKISTIGIRKRIYKTRVLARAYIFDYIEIFYNRALRPSHLDGVRVRRP